MAISDPRSASSSARVIVPTLLSLKTPIMAVWSDLFKVRMCDIAITLLPFPSSFRGPQAQADGAPFEPKGCPITLLRASALGGRLRFPWFAFDAMEE